MQSVVKKNLLIKELKDEEIFEVIEYEDPE